jgi:hypothetical protein
MVSALAGVQAVGLLSNHNVLGRCSMHNPRRVLPFQPVPGFFRHNEWIAKDDRYQPGGIEPRLPNPATAAHNRVKMLRILCMNGFKNFGQSQRQCWDSNQMDVVGHKTISQNQQASLSGILEDQTKKFLTVVV